MFHRDPEMLELFARSLINNGDGSYSLRTTSGSGSGTAGAYDNPSDFVGAFKKAFTDNGDGTFSLRIQ